MTTPSGAACGCNSRMRKIAQHPNSTAALVTPRPPDGSGIPFEYRYEVAGRDYIASFNKGGDPSRWPRIGERRTLVYASNSPQNCCQRRCGSPPDRFPTPVFSA
jgi:hypothetical protein